MSFHIFSFHIFSFHIFKQEFTCLQTLKRQSGSVDRRENMPCIFKGPEGEALLDKLQTSMKQVGRDGRWMLRKCSRARSKSGFDKEREKIFKKTSEREIMLFMKHVWITLDSISVEDKVKIYHCSEKVDEEVHREYCALCWK